MADTGLKVTGAIGYDGTWSNLTTTRINTSDNSRATTTSSTFDAGSLYNYSFGIPSGATIDGIEVQCEFNNSTAGRTSTIQFSLSHNNGTNYTATKSDTVVGTTDTTRTYGGAADLWGEASFSEYGTQDGNFYVKVEGKSNTFGIKCRLDHLQVKIYYHEAAANMFFLLMDD